MSASFVVMGHSVHSASRTSAASAELPSNCVTGGMLAFRLSSAIAQPRSLIYTCGEEANTAACELISRRFPRSRIAALLRHLPNRYHLGLGLRAHGGFEGDRHKGQKKVSTRLTTWYSNTEEPMANVDARPIIAAGGEPFDAIMAAVSTLDEGEELVVLTPFEPVPLEGVLSSQGFTYEAVELGAGDWQVTFRRPS